MKITQRCTVLAVLVSVIAVVTGCSRPAVRPEVRLGYLPIAECTPLFVAQSEHLFENHGIKVALTEFEDGPTVIAASLGGSLDGGLSGVVPILFAAEKDKPIKMVNDGGHVVPAPHPYVGLVVKASSQIQSVAELKGKTVAVNGLKTLEEGLLRVALNKAGIGHDVNVVTLPHPNMVQALTSGTIDASMAIEPYISMGLAEGSIRVLESSDEIIPSFQLSAIFFTNRFIEGSPDALARFTAAYNDAIRFIASNPDRAKHIVADWTKTPLATANSMTLPGWSTDLPIEGAKQVQKAMLENGILERAVNLDGFLYKVGTQH